MSNKISFWLDRSLMNKLYRLIYKVMRFQFVVLYFYFFPLVLVFANAMGSFILAPVNQPYEP